jgi:UDP-2,3-diacylglucosamine pyrophosphatase LpxH
MLVIISDLHLTDGTTGATLEPGAMDLFAERLADLAWRASWRAGGNYQPIERLDLVLLGDVLDIVHSQKWLASDLRPWSDLQSPAGSDAVAHITDGILRHNAQTIRSLRALATESVVTVPQANAAGEPVLDDMELPVAVRTHYMVGNHDWPLHLSGPQYDVLRHKVAHHLGLANQHNRPFPHDSSESEELHDALRSHRVLARHGDIHDPLAFSDDRNASSLSDVIAIELVGRFIDHLETELAGELPEAAVTALKEIDQVRPLLLIPAWMESLLERTVPQLSLRTAIKRTWDSLVEQMLALYVVRERNTWSPIDLIDGLSAALKFSRRDSSDWIGRTLSFLASLRGARTESYLPHALAEADFRNRRARHIVYGHTHSHETISLDASHADGYVLHQTYFNAGTWRRTYQPTKALSQQEFSASDTLSLLAFYQADERSGRAYETWSGTLAPSMIELGIQTPAPAARSVATGGHGLRAPHFAQAGARATRRV